MSFVMTQPDSLAAAARELHGAGAATAADNAAAATPTTGLVPAAADEVFTTTLAISADSYAATEAANAIAAG
jgi:hypothetical protein